jgi:hypothetical protein
MPLWIEKQGYWLQSLAVSCITHPHQVVKYKQGLNVPPLLLFYYFIILGRYKITILSSHDHIYVMLLSANLMTWVGVWLHVGTGTVFNSV